MINLFPWICFLVLMENNDGVLGKSPDYISEKANIVGRGSNAYGFLDRTNQLKVLEYCNKWRVDLPLEIHEYEKEYDKINKIQY